MKKLSSKDKLKWILIILAFAYSNYSSYHRYKNVDGDMKMLRDGYSDAAAKMQKMMK